MNPRLPSSPKAYRYDGSFDGFLCCVFESFLKKETPAAISAMALPARCRKISISCSVTIETTVRTAAIGVL